MPGSTSVRDMTVKKVKLIRCALGFSASSRAFTLQKKKKKKKKKLDVGRGGSQERETRGRLLHCITRGTNMAAALQCRRKLLGLALRGRGMADAWGLREISSVAPSRSQEVSSSSAPEVEDFASKILSEMRGRKGEEKESSSGGSAFSQQDSGSSYLSELTLRGLKARTDYSSTAETPLQKLSQLSRLGDMNQGPGYMFLPTKEHLLEKFYSEELMSSMERQKLGLQKVREEFRLHEGDCGSSQVQIALLTAKIKHMAEHMKTHKKDLHSRKGLQGMIEQRKKLLQYLRRTDWDAYCILITRLGLRDKSSESR